MNVKEEEKIINVAQLNSQLDVIKELLQDFKDNKITVISFVIAVDMLLNPRKITEEDVRWANSIIKEESK